MNPDPVMQALFNQQRLQVLHLGIHHNEFSDAYIYAWDEGVYPFFQDTDGSVTPMPHEIFGAHFLRTKEQVDRVTKLLDDRWIAKNVPTFDELENEFSNELDRMDLVKICRYSFLYGGFDDDFWNTLLTPMQCPSEAISINREFDRKKIYFE
ncbi:hypothetical protein [Pleionea litopenaei]|uniref:Uncharacterized protein n=1 Tax=Pleionea litopenaei TaxID=3070815 RepID=A0AA51RXM2_9GAMM|nr:hypothetical protein [Pleionea sp. HL-JVS1]WMS89302.1 hypothetical protein Q9312_19400 [Pleionea sp. HL-JVS1]WMS89323.1 hypothetical protein Q9312_19290 [Pleionea sp. HL-JVS1]